MKTPEKKTFGIRDRIHLFDTASRSNVDGNGGARYSKGNRYRGSDQHQQQQQQQTSPGRMARREERRQQRQKVDGSSDGVEKENELNKQISFTSHSKDYAVKKPSSPIVRRQKKKNKQQQHQRVNQNSAMDTNNPFENEKAMAPQVVVKQNEEEAANDTLEKQERNNNNRHCNDEMENRNRHAVHDESKNGNRKQRRERKSRHVENDQDADIADLNRAATGTSKDKRTTTSGDTSSSSNTNTHNRQTHSNNTHGINQHEYFKKRNPIEHPLIQSPLRKHIKSVHESACTNATCTMMKDPFPLNLAPSLGSTSALAAVAGWNTEDGMGSSSSGGGFGSHLDTLGSIMTGNGLLNGGTGLMSGTAARNSSNHGTGRGGYCDMNTNGAEMTNNNGGAEQAFDLLTSANFLFKHSRRNLG